MIKNFIQDEKKVTVECTNKQDLKSLESNWKKFQLKWEKEFIKSERGNYIIKYNFK